MSVESEELTRQFAQKVVNSGEVEQAALQAGVDPDLTRKCIIWAFRESIGSWGDAKLVLPTNDPLAKAVRHAVHDMQSDSSPVGIGGFLKEQTRPMAIGAAYNDQLGGEVLWVVKDVPKQTRSAVAVARSIDFDPEEIQKIDLSEFQATPALSA